MRRLGPRPGAGGRSGNRGEGETFEVMFHVFARLLPDSE